MIIYKFESKKQILTAIIWAVIIIAVLAGLMIAVYPAYSESKTDVMKVLEGFPPAFSTAFGINIERMFSFGGFYSFSFLYISLIGGVMSTYLAVDSFSREIRSKCSDFLLSKPISRSSIFVQKLLSGLTLLVATNAVYIFVCMAIGKSNDTDMFLASLSLFLTQLVFYALGVLYACFAKKVRSVSGAATVFGIAAFILSALINILEEQKLCYITPLKYFDPYSVFADGGYEAKYAVTGILVIIICISLSYLRFVKSDTKSV